MTLKTTKSLPASVPTMRLLIVPSFLRDLSFLLNFPEVSESFLTEASMMELRLWTYLKDKSALMLSRALLMPIDIPSFLSLTRMPPIEFSESKKRLSFSSTMITNPITLESSESSPMRMLTLPTDSFSASLKSPMDLVRDLPSMSVSRLDQLSDTSSSTMEDLTSSSFPT